MNAMLMQLTSGKKLLYNNFRTYYSEKSSVNEMQKVFIQGTLAVWMGFIIKELQRRVWLKVWLFFNRWIISITSSSALFSIALHEWSTVRRAAKPRSLAVHSAIRA